MKYFEIIWFYAKKRGSYGYSWFKKIVEKHKLSLDYQAFCYYARKELKIAKTKLHSPNISQNKKNNTQAEKQNKNNQDDIIIASPNFSKIKKFVPYYE